MRMFEDETGKLSGNSSDNSEEPEKGDLYHTEYVDLIYSAIAYPAERGVSDFNCRIALTNWHLYVTQELDSGRLADRYILDINDIEEVKISNPYMTSVDTDRCAASLEDRMKEDSTFRGGLFYRLFGISFSGRKGSGKHTKSRDKYLEIIFKGENGRREHLYFNQFDRSPTALIKKFEK